MAQARSDYGKVAGSRTVGGLNLNLRRIDMFKFMMICMILFTVVSIFHVWSRYRLIDLNLQISDSSRQLKEAEQEQSRLKLEIASLKTPSHIEAIAKGELGMALPKEQQVVIVK